MGAEFPSGAQVGVCQSGGLSALALAALLLERGTVTRHYVADLGQAPPDRLNELADSLRRCGAWATVVDLRPAMAAVTAEVLRHRARHDGGYWNTAGASRLVLVRELAPRMIADGCAVLAHGCVGGGNDQRRFDRYAGRLAPALGVYAPWTDPTAVERFPDRATMVDAVRTLRLPLDEGSAADRSTDANLAGASHELAALEDLRTPATVVRPRWSTWPADAPADGEDLTVRVDHGTVVDVGGSGADVLAWLARAHDVGARNGVWLRDVVEGRIVGTVCRGVYEAPALEVLDHAWRRVLEVSLDRPGRELYDRLSVQLGEAMYEARYLDATAVAARAALEELLAGASATVHLRVQRGTVRVTGTDVPGGVPRQQKRFAAGGSRWAEPATTGPVGG